ncbi:uncharacterized protein LOC128132964 [Lactuca sativa]|uniref:uncharacterized protein LOC128132964 n=1 Tax=Lactuca sativa TaxID=4236 RepID=UPI0022AF90CB|nr:uncharacterized protein LOC128132964 [Lactuca sativa]
MRRKLEKEFFELKQGGMTVNEYETQFNQRERFATEYIPTEDEKIQLFMERLRHEIHDFIVNLDILSFDKVVDYARRREYDLEIRGSTLTIPKHPRTERTVLVPSIPPAQFVRSEPNKRNHSGQCKTDKESVVYYGCGETGHIKPACPRKDVTCYACSNTGHKKRFCPTLTSQVTGSQDSVNNQRILQLKRRRDFVVEIEGYNFLANLIPNTLPNFDIILCMDWLSKNHTELFCYKKMVYIPIEGGDPIYVYGEQRILKIISFLKARKFISKGCPIYPNVFPDDFPGLTPDRQVEFRIDLVPGAAPIAKNPYRLASTEKKEIMMQL